MTNIIKLTCPECLVAVKMFVDKSLSLESSEDGVNFIVNFLCPECKKISHITVK